MTIDTSGLNEENTHRTVDCSTCYNKVSDEIWTKLKIWTTYNYCTQLPCCRGIGMEFLPRNDFKQNLALQYVCSKNKIRYWCCSQSHPDLL